MSIQAIKDSSVVLKVDCRWCNKEHYLHMSKQQCDELFEGKKHIQDIFPRYNADERELLITRTCNTCWDEMFLGN